MSTPTDGFRRSCYGITRRGLLLGAAGGLAAGIPLGWFGVKAWQQGERQAVSPFSGRSVEDPRATYAMPGPFPGRVIEVRHPGAVNPQHVINKETVRTMMDRGMCALVGTDHAPDAWRRFFQRDDVIGIKVNPVGRKANPGETARMASAVGSISSPEVLMEIVRNLKDIVGIPGHQIIVFERYATEFRQTGYEQVLRERGMEGVRWLASSHDYDEQQLEIDGQMRGRERDPNVAGYDPDVFVSMGFAGPEHNPRDDRRFRSHLSAIVTRMVNKIITIPCLKDHRSAGVTLALKNLSHGMNNNVARSHTGGIYRLDGARSDCNQCNTFIPTAVAQGPLRQKATLHIMDGLIGVYEGGPGCWNRTWGTWRRQSLFFATDPVAMDHVGWDIIDAKRAMEGWLPVARMTRFETPPPLTLSPRLAALAALSPESAAMAADQHLRIPDGRGSEFDRRQPEHIILAGLLGLGRFDAREIDHRLIGMR
ncbi:MAG TPA: DUF362 domain-containing protein [Gemmataceae bacterium]|nr:DUF362 domain-containing protein [Gemmataceae bacterium]